ncbi:MAG: tRNA glutamyl-Q(34) synthetase GluQRS [Lysobacteraceae bacterium]
MPNPVQPSSDPPYCGRFAPSPTGALHFGSLVAAFGSFLRARSQVGRWLVRVEDIDGPRTVPGAAAAQLETLRRFGLIWDGEVMFQSHRADAYEAALQRLREVGALFSCRCSRTVLAERGGIHRGDCGGSGDGMAALRVPAPDMSIGFTDAIRGHFSQNLSQDAGDFVVRRADGLYAYQLAVVVDDAAQGITEVVRGADLLDSTPRQLHLQTLLGLPHSAYAHLPLVLDEAGHKLGKSQQALALDEDDPIPALRHAWQFLGQNPAMLPSGTNVERLITAAITTFDLARVPARDIALSTLP